MTDARPLTCPSCGRLLVLVRVVADRLYPPFALDLQTVPLCVLCASCDDDVTDYWKEHVT